MADRERPDLSMDDMAGPVNQDVGRLIAGQSVPVQTVDYKRKEAMEFRPKTKGNICYIVMVVLFNNHNQVLLVQEAKKSCRGSWYLPAGRLEPNETFVAGAKREVKEEAGLTCDLLTLLSVHFGGSRWMRLSFLGTAKGGKLKTLDEQDEESLQAQFYDLTSVFSRKVNLRSADIVQVIQQALDYRQSTTSTPLHPALLPVIQPHRLLFHRVLMVVDCGHQHGLWMLAGQEGGPHIVTAVIAPGDSSLFITVHALIKLAIAEEAHFRPTLHGVVSVEHNGAEKEQDGMCLTTLVSLAMPQGQDHPPPLRSGYFTWTPVTDPSCRAFLQEGMHGHLCRVID